MTETKYGRVPLWLYETGVGLQAISAYGWLHGRYGHYERIMPSYATLAKELGVSRGSVIAYMKALISVGAIRIETSGAAGRQTNRYAIAFDEPFPVTGQNTDQGEGGQNADRSAECTPPGQPVEGGGQPVAQEEDVSTKTFLEEDEKISLPPLPAPRTEPDPVHEREISDSFKDQPTDPLPDAATRVAAAWTEAYKRSSGSEPSPKAVARVRASAGSRLRAGRAVDDLILIAVDMAETDLTWTDLGEHEAHWLKRQQQNATGTDDGMWERAMARARARDGLTGTDARVKGWLELANDLRDDDRQPHSTTDARVQAALDLGRQMQAEHDAVHGYQPYRQPSPEDYAADLGHF